MRFLSLGNGLLTGALLAVNPAFTQSAADDFQDCDTCPIMVNLPAGSFLMGTAVEDRLIDPRTGRPATSGRASTRSHDRRSILNGQIRSHGRPVRGLCRRNGSQDQWRLHGI